MTDSNTPVRVAIQGVVGCFHDAAAHDFFKPLGRRVDVVECKSFPALFDAMRDDASLLGIVAIENTIAGALLSNHELLRSSGLRIVGEYKMRISHVLCALPGSSLEDIREVNSHPMALMQCEQFLRRHPGMKLVEKFDTAGAAAQIAAEKLSGHAAVCGKYAARLYGLDILAEGIETNKRNFTRFLVVADPLLTDEFSGSTMNSDKASIMFTLPHSQGALAKVLSILSYYDLNLDKIQSTPIIGREWEYRFYVDLTYSNPLRWQQAVSAVAPLLNELKILGEYRSFSPRRS